LALLRGSAPPCFSESLAFFEREAPQGFSEPFALLRWQVSQFLAQPLVFFRGVHVTRRGHFYCSGRRILFYRTPFQLPVAWQTNGRVELMANRFDFSRGKGNGKEVSKRRHGVSFLAIGEL
jgi:hypothetical protein